jgi:hypothetical protein
VHGTGSVHGLTFVNLTTREWKLYSEPRDGRFSPDHGTSHQETAAFDPPSNAETVS